MAKLSRHDMRTLAIAYIALESKRKEIRIENFDYVPSRVRQLLELPLEKAEVDFNPDLIQAVKYCSKVKGLEFLTMFKQLHVMAYLITVLGLPFEMARKRYRLFTNEDKKAYSEFLKWVVPEHRVFFT